MSSLIGTSVEPSAVERFAQSVEKLPHAPAVPPTGRGRYEALMPATPPGPGQQYAFEVDLDRCSGCKACVTACHAMNALDAQETWRDVGALVGGTTGQPALQHVTTSCHHCVQPACLAACPVDAYEKDDRTGIVVHLDDQCIGCQYCTLACPYDAPKYNARLGIVRKCDMCADRLSEGEPPACVQACPHDAIAIRVVDQQAVIADAEGNAFLPGAPDPDYTLPTTSYATRRSWPRNLLPADYYSVQPEHAHWPLVIMLVLTQLSVGGFLGELWVRSGGMWPSAGAAMHPWFCLAVGLLAIAASTLHLGRPHLAFRALIGLRHSWLSREIAAFGAFSGLAVVYAGTVSLAPDLLEERRLLPLALGGAVAASGVLAVGCSIMVYHVVQRAYWRGTQVVARFAGSTAILGISSVLLTGAWHDWWSGDLLSEACGVRRYLWLSLAAAVLCKLAFELALLVHARDVRLTAMRRSAWLMIHPLRTVLAARLVCGLAGLAVALLAAVAVESSSFAWLPWGATAAFILLLAGEFCERYLFFAAVTRSKMPGGVAS